MKTLVVYDSFFGNTEKIAQAIGEGFGSGKSVQVVNVKNVADSMLEALDFLIVGSPTRAFSPSPAIKSFVNNLNTEILRGVKVAAFDTRLPMGENVPGFLRFMVKLFGYADKPMHDKLVKKGGQAAAEPMGFYVLESEGPLKDGEEARASAWAQEIKKG